ncbi:DUF3578 domain-containing protein [Nocardia vulneris]|uniref:MrcB family domain-containing protein n=1 Tax=Nocardia vulneris TaxID=1141657 RepID=UPI0030CFD8E2
MPLGDVLSKVLELQSNYTPNPKSALMKQRKDLVEHLIPDLIRSELAVSWPAWNASGSGGKGAPAEVPWSRYFDPVRSPAPTDGWYVVYLFDARGESVYLSLNQGTTTWDVERQDFTFRPAAQLAQRVEWARKVLVDTNAGPQTFRGIDLKGKQRLGRVYQFGNVHGIEYRAAAMPSDAELRDDLLQFGQLLDHLYKAEDETLYIPGDEPPEIADAQLAADQAAGKTRRPRKGGQGFRLNQAEKKAIELHAVALATVHFEALGYKVKDTGAVESYDLLATRPGEAIYVEVKGTASPGDQIVVTRAEVEHHLKHYPDNALVVVHSILLDRTSGAPVAYGGTPVVTQPWKIDETALTPISFRYRIPPVVS